MSDIVCITKNMDMSLLRTALETIIQGCTITKENNRDVALYKLPIINTQVENCGVFSCKNADSTHPFSLGPSRSPAKML